MTRKRMLEVIADWLKEIEPQRSDNTYFNARKKALNKLFRQYTDLITMLREGNYDEQKLEEQQQPETTTVRE
jgi:hypothetical protein